MRGVPVAVRGSSCSPFTRRPSPPLMAIPRELPSGFLAVCLLLGGCAGHVAPPSAVGAVSVSLQPLQGAEQSEGCGCSFSLRPQRSRDVPQVFALDLPSGQALVRVNGSLVRLTKIESEARNKRQGHHTVGDDYREVWASEGVRVVLDYKTTFACRDGDTSCEVTSFEGRMVVRVGDRSAAFKVWGD